MQAQSSSVQAQDRRPEIGARAGLKQPIGRMLLVFSIGVSACASGAGGAARSSESMAPPTGGASGVLWGQVKRKQSGGDTVLVSGARVWTDPFSDEATTDSVGYWEISTGLATGRYKVLVDVSGKKDSLSQVPAEVGKRIKVPIVVGGDANATWNVAWEADTSSKLEKRPGGVRSSP